MSPEVIADRLHLGSIAVKRVLQSFRPGNPEIHDRMLGLAETLERLSTGFPGGDLSEHGEVVRTTERYLRATSTELAVCARRGYGRHAALWDELSRLVDELRAISGALGCSIAGSARAPADRAAA